MDDTAPPPAEPADPLAFDPVPRRIERVDGWTAERQRAFIDALAVSGSPRRAATAVGKAHWGAEQLRKARGAESFSAAWDRALAIAGAKGSARLAAGIHAVAAEDNAWAPARGPWQGHPGAPPRHAAAVARRAAQDERMDPDPEMLAEFVWKRYVIKLAQESEARAAGKIAAADFYLRQITHIEVILEAAAAGQGLLPVLADLRLQGRPALSVAETDATRLLDEMRRSAWAAEGEALRPEPIAEEWLKETDGLFTEPLEATHGGGPLSHEEQQQAYRARYEAAAQAQVEWEAEARQDFEARGEASQPQNEGEHRRPAEGGSRSDGASAGQPAPEGRQD